MRCSSCDRLRTHLRDRIQFQDKKLVGFDLGNIIYNRVGTEFASMISYFIKILQYSSSGNSK